MLPFPAALISKERGFCFPVPKKTVEHFSVVFKFSLRVHVKTKL